MDKSADAFRTISEVAEELDLPQHVLRFWETRFTQIKPLKRGGGRRYYRPDDVDLLRGIRYLLYGQGYTIKGVQRIIKEGGGKFVQNVWRDAGLAAAGPPLSSANASGEDLSGDVIASNLAPHDAADDDIGLLADADVLDADKDQDTDEQPLERPTRIDTYRPPPGVAITRGGVAAAKATVQAQGAVLVRRPDVPGLSVADRKTLQLALNELTEARRLLDLAGRMSA